MSAAASSDPSKPDSIYLITGFPGDLARRAIAKVSARDGRGFVLAPAPALKEAQRSVARAKANLEVLSGQVQDMHLGLSGLEYERVCDTVTEIFHLVPSSYLTSLPRRAHHDGIRNILEFAKECIRLERFNYLSSCFVSGDRVGVIAEDELDRGQGFRNPIEEAAFAAEQQVDRASAALPISIYRPASLVGDSKSGEIDRFEGPYYLILQWVSSPIMLALPLPGDGSAPLNVVPVDFVWEAIWALSTDPRALGRTFHLVDPNPMSTRRICELIAEKANRRIPGFSLSAKAAEVVLRLPILEKLARPERAALNYLNHLAFYNSRNTLELLEGTGVRCPPLTAYLDTLANYFQRRQEHERLAEPIEDALEPPISTRASE
jgi:thioester reductase-like protein